jgi:uncharacterized protein (DUF2384 family)
MQAQMLDMTPDQAIAALQHDLGLALDDLALALHVDVRTIRRWQTNGMYPQRETRDRLAALLRLRQSLLDFFQTSQDAQVWLAEPQRYLGWMTPVEALRAGRPSRAEAALEVMREGMSI